MAQFEVFRVGKMLVVDLQSDFIGVDYSRIVAPLRKEPQYQFLPRLTPKVLFNGDEYVVHVHDLASLSRSELGTSIGTLGPESDDLLRAIDILTRGF